MPAIPISKKEHSSYKFKNLTHFLHFKNKGLIPFCMPELHKIVPNFPIVFTKKEKSFKLHSPSELLNLILKQGEKGLSLQRYKGLGEMNADQLWETTLDPDSRSLLQVKIEQSAEEGTTFSDLMGDDVEPRRIFIQEQALNVSNLDF